MDLFDDKDKFKDQVNIPSATDIPDFLSWEKMGPPILAGVSKRKRQRRMLIWWRTSGLIVITLCLISLFYFPNTTKTLDAFPIRFIKQTPIVTINTNQTQTNGLKRAEADKDNSTKTLIPMPTTPSKPNPSKLILGNQEAISISISKKKFLKNKNLSKVNKPLSPLYKKISPIKSISKRPLKLQDNFFIANLPTLTTFIAIKTANEIDYLPKPKKSEQDISKWQIEIAGGINRWVPKIGPADKKPYVTTLLGGQINARLSRKLSKRWVIKSGLQWQLLRYRSTYSGTKDIKIYQPNTIDTIYTASFTGRQSIVYTDSIAGLQTRNFQHYNRHTSLQLPILIGLEIGKKRFQWSIQSGISLQLLHRSVGRLALGTGDVSDLPNKNLYTNNFSLSYLLETQISFQLTNKVAVLGRFGGEKHLNNWVAKTAAFHQQPQIYYSSFGLRWSLDN